MNRSDIRKKLGVKTEVKVKKFIYFLTMDQVVVYIGQTTSLELRISKHHNDGKKFEDFYYIECHPSEANKL
jgi:predicted GIY-YIG superfamily endonuclease